MTYGLVRISENQRDALFKLHTVRIRRQFVDAARACYGAPVLIYQSVRQPVRDNRSVGCFAKAVMGLTLPVQGDPTHFDVVLSNLEALANPHRGLAETGTLVNKAGRLRGWVAASDVREISKEWYLEVTGEQAIPRYEPEDFHDQPEPIFGEQPSLIRDPKFRSAVYAAYRGRCAFTGITMLVDGRCGLQAAHCFPVSQYFRFDVSAGFLAAPSWHTRVDIGAILIHDNYTWSAVVEDSDTLTISDRRLLLPLSASEWPDQNLLRRRRQLFGYA